MLPEVFDVTDKVVFITGAGRGIGKGIAQVLAEAGADVAINSLTPRYVEGVAAEIAAASGRKVVPVIADVTRTDDVQRAIDQVMETFGRIDVLINNLGDAIRKPLVALPGKETAALTDEELSLVMDVNLTEAILCTRAVGPHMLARRSGKVINISSWTARQGGGDMVVYSIAKTGPGRLYAGTGARMGAVRGARQQYRAGHFPRSGDGRGRRDAASQGHGGAHRAVDAHRRVRLHDRTDPFSGWRHESVGGWLSGALSRLGRIRLHDRT